MPPANPPQRRGDRAPPPAGSGTVARGAAPGDGWPGDTTRSAATVLLLLYLVGLGLCVAANTASGTSALVGAIKDRLFSPWMVPPWLDLGHDTRLTYGLPEDGDHHVEIVPRAAGARAVRLPAPGDRSGAAARWRRLARTWAVAEEEGDEVGALLPAAFAGVALERAGSDDVVVRLRRVVPLDLARAGAAPVEETVLEGRARLVTDGDEVEVEWIPMPPAEELAPLVGRSGEGAR